MLRSLAPTNLHEGHKNGVMCRKKQQSFYDMESLGDLEQHIRKVFLEEFEYVWERASLHTQHMEGGKHHLCTSSAWE